MFLKSVWLPGSLFWAVPGVARADELATLRANQAALSAQQIALDREQELLKARIEQLAQGPNPGSNPGAPGAPTPAAPTGGGSFARSLLIPGTNTSIRVGGFIDKSIFYYTQNGPANGVPSVTAEIDGNLETQPLFTGGHVVPGYPTAGNLVPVNVQSCARQRRIFPISAAIAAQCRDPDTDLLGYSAYVSRNRL